ncbi:uncharacterized protein LOC123714566 isoform X1 [Pieris brassicae]|uniref:uncharacterized protein LOC123714566 isoform X1 n=2 Tax=Pieris brassicae TaxID=7116 RepID=UPI001E662543|nr:uncharacterized protein LOC123714566 isoform X1 [Pieris brassicae]
MNNCASDLVINSIKTLIDNCRCVNCDHLNQIRHRFSCGHSICEVCIETSNTCMLCSPTSSNATPVIDNPQTDRVQHASKLLNTFQSLFDVDVYRKQRISEKLKVEKELFPKCIQAPIKYYNKRKSSILIDKENIETLLPGENIYPCERVKMENSKTYVKQWLNQNQNSFSKEKKVRLPFTDLNTNSCKSKNLNNKDKSISKKRKLNKTACSPTSIYKLRCKENRGFGIQKCNNHESGIELDDDICFINDSQSEILDKDELAQIAILEADKKSYSFLGDSLYVSKDKINHIQPNHSLNLRNEHIKNVPITSKLMTTSPYKVPFYKKSKLFDSCKLCATYIDEKFTNVIKMKNVTVTIDNPSFITTIQIFEDQKHAPEYKSIGIQTQKIEVNLEKPATDMELFHKDIRDAGSNVHKHEDAIKKSCQVIHKAKGIVIEDSDCDSSDNEASTKLEVMADIHRACKYDDYVFRELNSYEYGNRVIPRVRGKTPASSDSSDKENYNPNRKKQKLNSKCKKK